MPKVFLSFTRACACTAVLFALVINCFAAEKLAAVGDTPATAPASAKLSGKMKPRDIEKAMRKVADWQLAKSEQSFDLDWTFAALYTGFMAAFESVHEPRYEAAMMAMGKKHNWNLGSRLTHADDQAVAQTYLQLSAKHNDPAMIAPLRKNFDQIMQIPDDPKKPVWWWCDALFMAPPVWIGLYRATHDKRYLDYMDHQWWITSDLLYDAQLHLYSRDAGYLDKKEANGAKLFWLRGNGWVMAGIVRVLEQMPSDYPSRPRYVQQLREMAAKTAELQGSDGLWRPGLLNAEGYPYAEVSGSAFITYALARGINDGYLDRKTYKPVVAKAWKALVSNVYEDGRLGNIQPIGAAPEDFKPQSSYVYGVGAYLLAGSEVKKLAERK
jgi:unsaturated rhamnogalacturonyl hydrolase